MARALRYSPYRRFCSARSASISGVEITPLPGTVCVRREYIIRRLTDREITVVGNPRVYKALRSQMELIYQELQRLAVDEEVPPDLLETLQMVALTLNGLKEECE